MKRSSEPTATQNYAKRTRNTEGRPSPNASSTDNVGLLRYENPQQFKRFMDDPNFDDKLSLPPNKDIIHRIVTNTRSASDKEIHEIKQILGYISVQHRNLLNFLAYKENQTPLHQPNVHLELIKFLINRGARVDRVTRTREFTFVHVAAQHLSPDEFHELVKFLVEMELGELMKARDDCGATPLHVAVYNMEVREDTISLCAKAEGIKVPINCKDNLGRNVLVYAILGGRNAEYLNLLRGLWAVPVIDECGRSVLDHAACAANIDAIKLFGSVRNFYREAVGGKTALHYVLASGRRNIHEVVKALLERCKEAVMLQDDEGQTPLWLAKYGPQKDKIEPRTVELLQRVAFELRENLLNS